MRLSCSFCGRTARHRSRGATCALSVTFREKVEEVHGRRTQVPQQGKRVHKPTQFVFARAALQQS